MKTLSFIAPLFLMTFLLASCAPQQVLRLETEHEDKMVYRGMEYLYSEGENSAVTLAYYRHLGDRVIFDLEVVNYSDTLFQVDVSDFRYSAYSHQYYYNPREDKGLWETKLVAETTAIDPEETILNIDRTVSRVEARERTNVVFSAIASGLNAVDGIASAGSETSRQRAEREQRRTRMAIERAERREQFYRNVSSLGRQRQYWETEALRRTDLLPGDAIAGEVSFPAAGNAMYIQIAIEVAGDVHEFEYTQRRFSP
jgi:hypothetical protein